MKAEDLTELLESGEMTTDEICPVLYTMSILGQRWKLPILWHLADEGTLRYNELKRGIPLITNIMLTQSLRELERSYLIYPLNLVRQIPSPLLLSSDRFRRYRLSDFPDLPCPSF